MKRTLSGKSQLLSCEDGSQAPAEIWHELQTKQQKAHLLPILQTNPHCRQTQDEDPRLNAGQGNHVSDYTYVAIKSQKESGLKFREIEVSVKANKTYRLINI